ncbi:anthranilate synthase component I family protein [Sphingobacterium sp. Mn56C]|uniref:anthranilate synthase component I family protein n=1 Tax=Sphingobacterium sp. Mn56C TaxID=3395261 RepID=UPI003BD4A021
MAKAIFEVEKEVFETRALLWAQQFEQVCFLQSNGYSDAYSALESILAVDARDTFTAMAGHAFMDLEDFKARYPKQWVLGFFGYDLKNEIERLHTSFDNPLDFPDAYFFVPKIVFKFYGDRVEIDAPSPMEIYHQVMVMDNTCALPEQHCSPFSPIVLRKRMSKVAYFEAFAKMQHHIKRGDIYEVNLCQEFYAEKANIDPLATYRKLNLLSPTPFSTFFKLGDKYILSASPERFLAKRDQTLISQPIKGTAPRGKTIEEDERMKHTLQTNPKEIAENVMIVDLVRNDMTLSAQPGTVAAERKLEVHSFKQVHQLISTITCTQKNGLSPIAAIKNIFPPGSMTGAPKIRAMELCDNVELSRRGVYAGAVGYFAPNEDFDFNVVIRTLLYNKTRQYLSFHTGGALTFDAVAEDEYNECILKASAITSVLGASLDDA